MKDIDKISISPECFLRNLLVSEEVFDKAQAITLKRSIPRGTHKTEGFKRQKYSEKYAFSCMIECAFCGGTFTRRCWHSG
ncbi:MAG: hypothetical protein ACRCX8_11105 [Sarcina sp.]